LAFDISETATCALDDYRTLIENIPNESNPTINTAMQLIVISAFVHCHG